MAWKDLPEEITEEFSGLSQLDKRESHSILKRSATGKAKDRPARLPHWTVHRRNGLKKRYHSRGADGYARANRSGTG